MRGGHAGIPRQRVPSRRIPVGGSAIRELTPQIGNRQTSADASNTQSREDGGRYHSWSRGFHPSLGKCG